MLAVVDVSLHLFCSTTENMARFKYFIYPQLYSKTPHKAKNVNALLDSGAIHNIAPQGLKVDVPCTMCSYRDFIGLQLLVLVSTYFVQNCLNILVKI